MRRFSKLLTMFFLSLAVTCGSFVAGLVFYARLYPPPEPVSAEMSSLNSGTLPGQPVDLSKMLDETPAIGYVRLTQFSQGAARKLSQAIRNLLDQGATALIFDLRSNPGGLLSEAVEVSSLSRSNFSP